MLISLFIQVFFLAITWFLMALPPLDQLNMYRNDQPALVMETIRMHRSQIKVPIYTHQSCLHDLLMDHHHRLDGPNQLDSTWKHYLDVSLYCIMPASQSKTKYYCLLLSIGSQPVNLIKRITNIKKSKSPVNNSTPSYSMDNPVFEDNPLGCSEPLGGTITSKRNTIHLRSGSCPSQLLQVNLGSKSGNTGAVVNKAEMFNSQRVKSHKERGALHGFAFHVYILLILTVVLMMI